MFRSGRSAFPAFVLFAIVLLVPVWWGIDASSPWDADNIAPGSVLKAMAAHFGPGWHSSYGPVPYLLTALVYAPLLALFKLTGELGHPAAAFPWGFRHPDAAIAMLVVVARLVPLALAVAIAALAVRDEREAPAGVDVPAWLPPLLLAGSPTFVYYARTSNVDMPALVFAWAALSLATRPRASLVSLGLAAAAGSFAVCCKEQVAPFAVVAVLVAAARAWRGAEGTAVRGISGALRVFGAAIVGYALVWLLPFNFAGWAEHHRFIFETARYPRTYAADAPGMMALASRCLGLTPVVLGSAILAGVVLAVALRASWRGTGARLVAVALYLAGFIGVIGYVYPRFLLPLLIVAVPAAARGWASLLTRPRWRVPGLALLALLVLVGGPALDAVQLTDTRYVVERWLARLPDGATVEVFGNPHFQARVPRRLSVIDARAEALLEAPRGPRGDVVLVSAFDRASLEQGPLRTAYGDSLLDARRYRRALKVTPPAWARLVFGLTVSPVDEIYVRRDGPADDISLSLPPARRARPASGRDVHRGSGTSSGPPGATS